ncbi:cupin domain-containing protein [Candidatus Nitrospira salsa]
MIKEDINHDTQNMNWQELREFPGPAEVKVLREEKDLGAKTMLLRVPPQGKIIPHSHRGVVQHYVLDGHYETEGKSFGPGSFRLMPEHAEVAPITTEKGVTILMIYDAVR